MPDLDSLAKQIGGELAALVGPMLKRMEAECVARIAAASVRDAIIDRTNCLILTFGDGATKNLGCVVGRDGVDGKDGASGEIGQEGPQGPQGSPGPEPALEPLLARLDAAEGRSIADAQVTEGGLLTLALKDGETLVAGPVLGRDGVDGKDGAAGAPGVDGKDATLKGLGLDPERIEYRLSALEGRSITEALIDREGSLVLTFSNGENLFAGKIIGRDGVDGRDGRDGVDGKPGEMGPAGLGFDDLDVTLHGDGRTLVLAFSRGERVERFEIALPSMVYRGVFEPGRIYAPGDTVTFGGSSWVCNAQTTAKPGETEKTWTLAVKRGRDGKDFAGPQIKVGS